MDLNQAIQTYLSFLESKQDISPHTLKNYAIDLNQFLAFIQKKYQGMPQLNFMQPSDIRSFLLHYKDLTASSRSRKLSSIRSLFRFFHQIGTGHQPNMAQTITHPKKPKLLPKPVRMDVIHELVSKKPDWSNNKKESRNYTVFLMLFGCGLRVSELTQIGERDISSDFRWLRVKGKGRKERDVPIPSLVAETLHLYLKHQKAYISPEKLFPMSVRTVQRVMKQLMLEHSAQGQFFSPHQLRHSYASHLLSNGANLKGIQELLGHHHLTSTEIYTHIHIDKLSEIIDACHPASLSEKDTEVDQPS